MLKEGIRTERTGRTTGEEETAKMTGSPEETEKREITVVERETPVVEREDVEVIEIEIDRCT